MNCPLCNVTLQIAERQGVELDFCPKCRGVWLDRGELDKIMERASQEMNVRPPNTEDRKATTIGIVINTTMIMMIISIISGRVFSTTCSIEG